MAITDARSVGNALLGYPYKAEFNGYPAFLIQKMTLPKREFEESQYGGGAQTLDVKQAGGEKISEITLETIVSAAGDDRMYWQKWQDLVRTRDTSQYWRDGTITLLGPGDMPSIIWDVQDAWPKLVEWETFDTTDKKKLVIIKITMACYDCRERIV